MPAGRPAICAANGCGVEAGPTIWSAVAAPYAVVAPNSTWALVGAPPVSSEPAIVALEAVTFEAAPVTTSLGA